jgi:hypothetical protein
MSKFALHVDGNDNVIEGFRCGDNRGYPNDASYRPCTEAQHAEYGSAKRYFERSDDPEGEGLQRYKYVNDVLTEQIDPRETATWSKTLIQLVKGGPGTTVNLTLSERRTENDVELVFDNRTIKVNFASGVATLRVSSTERGLGQGEFKYSKCAGYKMTNTLVVEIIDPVSRVPDDELA